MKGQAQDSARNGNGMVRGDLAQVPHCTDEKMADAQRRKGTSPGCQRRLLGAIVRPEVRPSATQSLTQSYSHHPAGASRVVSGKDGAWGQDGCSVAVECFLPPLSEDLPGPGQPLHATTF